jgi:hypothetical protein
VSAITTFDMTEFQRVLNRHIELSSREMSRVINSRMYNILIRALRYTPKADRGKIERYLGAVTTTKISKRGKERNEIGLSKRPLAYAIVNARSIKAGKGAIPQDQVAQAALKFVGATLRSIGTLRAGWRNAISRFTATFGGVMRYEKLPRVKEISRAKPAGPGISPIAEAAYRLLAKSPASETNHFIHESVIAATDRAFAEEYREMAAHVQKKIEEINRRARRN